MGRHERAQRRMLSQFLASLARWIVVTASLPAIESLLPRLAVSERRNREHDLLTVSIELVEAGVDQRLTHEDSSSLR